MWRILQRTARPVNCELLPSPDRISTLRERADDGLDGLREGRVRIASVLVSRWLMLVTPNADRPLWVWIAAPIGLAMVVAAASAIPSWRALRIDPLTVMRE